MSALPSPEYSRNMRLIGHSDQGGRPDGVQLMVHRGFAYIGHMVSQGFSVVDVRDPTRPTTVNYIAAPPGTWNVHLQAHDDLLLVINADLFKRRPFADEKVYHTCSVGDTVSEMCSDKGWSAGPRIFDISPRAAAGNQFRRLTASVFTASGTSAGAGRMCPCRDSRFYRLHLPGPSIWPIRANPKWPGAGGCRDAPGGR